MLILGQCYYFYSYLAAEMTMTITAENDGAVSPKSNANYIPPSVARFLSSTRRIRLEGRIVARVLLVG